MTKLLNVFLLVILCHFHVIAQVTPTINADFNKGLITINDVTFTKNSTVADYEKVLGKPERIEKIAGQDRVFAYDKLGIALMVNPSTKGVEDINITYIYDGDKKVAKEAFKGKLSINGQEIKTQTTSEEIGKLVNTTLLKVMKGYYMSKRELMNLVLYYPETTLGQISFSFAEIK